MTNCYYCNGEVHKMPYKCKFCGLIFCNNHRLPENHECAYDLRTKATNDNLYSSILYVDALDYMNTDLTVAKIYDYVTTKQLNDLEATKLLTVFIEESEIEEIRINSILACQVLGLKNDIIYDVLENSIISDTNPEIKNVAVRVLSDLFPKKSKKLLDWVQDIHHNHMK